MGSLSLAGGVRGVGLALDGLAPSYDRRSGIQEKVRPVTAAVVGYHPGDRQAMSFQPACSLDQETGGGGGQTAVVVHAHV